VKILWLLWILTPTTDWYIYEDFANRSDCLTELQAMVEAADITDRGSGYDYSCRPTISAGDPNITRSET